MIKIVEISVRLGIHLIIWDTKKGRAERASPAAGPGPARGFSRPESGGREGRRPLAVEGKPAALCALVQAMHTPRSIPSMLAALAGFAIAAVALRLEEMKPPKKPRRPDAAPPGADRASDEPHSLQVARAAQPGRGRSADAPTQIPSRGWKDISLAHL
jgi:hypothetical protein